jgi:S-adenosylmethionine:tRNA ribosyltransferase-isomerase
MHSLSDFDFALPEELIAQRPLELRDQSRLLSLDRLTGSIQHHQFAQLPQLIAPGDVLVVNKSRVIPARLTATRENGRQAEVLLVREIEKGVWSAMVHPGGKLKVGRRLFFGDTGKCEVIDVIGGGLRVLRFEGLDVSEIMTQFGSTPLPPYIERDSDNEDRERYQTIFAEIDGSAAAPTAGLHFTDALMSELKKRGVNTATVTLHVGPGTFKPVSVEDISQHSMHSEYYELSAETAETLNSARSNGARVWAVGTTSARVLETCGRSGKLIPGTGLTDIFITPGYKFRSIDALITNFHLPRSTLLMLVAAFAGLDPILNAYREAVSSNYRFFSYGDAMVIH